MSDVVPLAVAFQEVCHAMFNGSEEAKCQTRLIGDMMVSFAQLKKFSQFEFPALLQRELATIP